MGPHLHFEVHRANFDVGDQATILSDLDGLRTSDFGLRWRIPFIPCMMEVIIEQAAVVPSGPLDVSAI